MKNAASLRFCITLLALHGASAFRMNKKGTKETTSAAENELLEASLNSEVVALSKQGALAQMDGKQLTQVLTTVLGLLTSLVSAFVEDPPDFEYAFDTMNIQGWKLVKTVVPEHNQRSRDFKNAQRAWRAAFMDAGEITEELVDASKKGDVRAILDSVMRIVNTALETAAAAVPHDGDLILAINDLVQGHADSVFDFVTAMGWLPGNGAFAVPKVQSDALVVPAMESHNLVQLLTTGIGIVTTFVSAFTENPPDFEYAFDSMNLQGWKIVKLLVPETDQRKDSFKNAQKAWRRVFSNAADLTEEIMRASKGDIAAIVTSVLKTVDTALKTAADVVEPDVAKILDGVGSLIVGVGGDWVQFSSRVGWLS